MSVDVAAQAHAAHLSDASADLVDALEALSPASRRAFLDRWMQASLELQSTGSDASIKRMIESLRITAHLHNRDDYKASLVAAEDDPWDEPVDIAGYLAKLHDDRKPRA